MRVRFSKHGNIAIGFQLTPAEIELQVATDLTNYRKAYRDHYGSGPAMPLDVESFVKELWQVEVAYEDIPQLPGEEVLGYLAPEIRTIVIDPRICSHPRRTSFTVAHEAGHLSLHSFMFTTLPKGIGRTTRQKLKADRSVERQANIYAAHLLAPKHELVNFLHELGMAGVDSVASAIDMEKIVAPLQERFGLSRHAMEVHFRRLGIPMKNVRYSPV